MVAATGSRNRLPILGGTTAYYGDTPRLISGSTSKKGVIAFSEKASVEWAPLGIRINCVAPGVIRTEGWDLYSEEVQSCYSKTNPLMRSGDAWEVAEAIVFLSSPAASFINGETLVIDGGGRHWGEIWTTGKPEYFQAASRVCDDKKSEE